MIKKEPVIDGKWQLWWKTGTLTCCDCGLVHDTIYKTVKDKRVLKVKYTRNEKETKAQRRSMKRRGIKKLK